MMVPVGQGPAGAHGDQRARSVGARSSSQGGGDQPAAGAAHRMPAMLTSTRPCRRALAPRTALRTRTPVDLDDVESLNLQLLPLSSTFAWTAPAASGKAGSAPTSARRRSGPQASRAHVPRLRSSTTRLPCRRRSATTSRVDAARAPGLPPSPAIVVWRRPWSRKTRRHCRWLILLAPDRRDLAVKAASPPRPAAPLRLALKTSTSSWVMSRRLAIRSAASEPVWQVDIP